MSVFVPLSTQPVFFQGKAQVGAQITVYDAGTLTPRTAYGDGLLTTPLAQPILSDGNGCIPEMWIQGNPYRVRILASTGIQIRDVDNLPGEPTAVSPPPPPPGTVTLQTGDLVWNYGTSIIPGRVRANGKTIGNALSGASEFADPSTQNLFTWLWNGDPNLVVIGGRGLTAAADYAANKAITLPDVNGRTPFGLDGMGSLPTGRLTGATFTSGNASTLGSTGGTAQETLTTAQLPAHTHTATTQSAGSHQHTGTTAASGAAAVNAVTDVQGYHAHTGATAGSGNFGAGGATDAQGNHSHGGATGGRSAQHNHTVSGPPAQQQAIAGTGAVTGYWYGPPQTVTTAPEPQDHTHTIAVDGNHAHNVSVTVPNHTHGIAGDGNHQHNVTVPLIAHAHTFVSDPAGLHTHTLTSDPTGGGGPHNNCPPFILVTFYLIL
jgi:microcystin-dependent protein